MSAKHVTNSFTTYELRKADNTLIASIDDEGLARSTARKHAVKNGYIVRVSHVEVIKTSRLVANYG